MRWLRDRLCFRKLALICSIAITPGDAALCAASPSQQPASKNHQRQSPEQLDSLVAPIALYPDSLLGQVLAASTYALQLATAQRWVRQNSNLEGKALVVAAGKQNWDPSIQALVAFPAVLLMMGQCLGWTTALGNAFLAQQSDVLEAVQRMRMKAKESGQLLSNAQQQIQATTVEGQPTIVIQPTDPQVIYVPAYQPAVVYGAAPPHYPYPAIAYPTGIWAGSAISFGPGVAVGTIFSGCCGGGSGWGWACSWGRHPSLYVNAANGRVEWSHTYRYDGGRGGVRAARLPLSAGIFRPPGSQGSMNRLMGDNGVNKPGGRGVQRHRGGGRRP